GISIYNSYDYTISPALELQDANGNVLGSDWYGLPTHPTVTDAGSATNRDPFLEYDFNQAGIYRIRVRSFIDYAQDNPYFSDGLLNGVARGQAYVLNLSLQQHAVNTAAIALAQKTITIIDGQGRGQSAKIVDYDPESKEYTLDREWTTPPN